MQECVHIVYMQGGWVRYRVVGHIAQSSRDRIGSSEVNFSAFLSKKIFRSSTWWSLIETPWKYCEEVQVNAERGAVKKLSCIFIFYIILYIWVAMVSYLMSTEDRWNNFKENLLFKVWLCNVWIWIVQYLLRFMHTWWWCERQKKTGTETSTHGYPSKIIVYSIIASLYVGGEAEDGSLIFSEDGPLIFSNQRPSWFGSAAWNRYSAPLANLDI